MQQGLALHRQQRLGSGVGQRAHALAPACGPQHRRDLPRRRARVHWRTFGCGMSVFGRPGDDKWSTFAFGCGMSAFGRPGGDRWRTFAFGCGMSAFGRPGGAHGRAPRCSAWRNTVVGPDRAGKASRSGCALPEWSAPKLHTCTSSVTARCPGQVCAHRCDCASVAVPDQSRRAGGPPPRPTGRVARRARAPRCSRGSAADDKKGGGRATLAAPSRSHPPGPAPWPQTHGTTGPPAAIRRRARHPCRPRRAGGRRAARPARGGSHGDRQEDAALAWPAIVGHRQRIAAAPVQAPQGAGFATRPKMPRFPRTPKPMANIQPHPQMANAIRALAMDAVQQANSGHAGAPMGMADMAVALWGQHLKHNPADPRWFDRDRFVLSNGHGSMLLYALLHLTGYDLSIDELKNFRQLHSKTAGHPEVGLTPGVETTTGPLGQGIANAVGFALAEKLLAAEYNRAGNVVVDDHSYVFH